MYIDGNHITYCMNIHRGEAFDEVKEALRVNTARVKDAVCPDRPFGLGLRLSGRAAAELEREGCERFAGLLGGLGMYAFTINGFPYGEFHRGRIKENVYLPDWSDERRLSYTLRLLRLLAGLLPEGVDGSISTVPVCYGKKALDAAIAGLLRADEEARRICRETGRRVGIALEPEPDCFFETAEEVAGLWNGLFGGADHLGICFDTCHFATNFERPATALERIVSAGAPVFKIQISSSLELNAGYDPAEVLEPFDDGVYLHQVRVKDEEGNVLRYPDVTEALKGGAGGRWRLHFHVPLHWAGAGALAATRDEIDGRFLAFASSCCSHFEVETYTFHVMPQMRRGVVESITDEIRWLTAKMAIAGPRENKANLLKVPRTAL